MVQARLVRQSLRDSRPGKNPKVEITAASRAFKLGLATAWVGAPDHPKRMILPRILATDRRKPHSGA